MGKAELAIPRFRRRAWRGASASAALAIALMGAIDPADSDAKKTKPDLRVTSLSTSATSAAGAGLDAADSTGNRGNRPAPRSTTGFLLSRDERRDKTDLVLEGQRAVPKLKPRGKSGGRARLGVSQSTPPGRYRLLACADIGQRIAEANESNNCKASAGFVEVTGSGTGPPGPNPPQTTPPQTTPPETTPPAPPSTAVAFRFTDLDLRDPHVVVTLPVLGTTDFTDGEIFGFPSVNSQLQKNLTTDADEDGHFDLSPVNLFDPFDQGAATMPAQIDPGATCVAPPQPSACEAGSPIATTATNSSTSPCLDVLAGTTTASYTPEVAIPTAPCFVTDEGNVTLSLAGIPITLHGARVGATYVGDPATAEENGLIRGFLSEADADATIIPADLAAIGGQPLSKLFPGGKDNPSSHDDRDVREAVTGWWVYLNFTATRTPWAQ